MQTVNDLWLPSLYQGRIVLTSEAGIVARPHTGAGVLKAIMNAQSLVKELTSVEHTTLDAALQKWSDDQVKEGGKRVNLGRAIGKGMVFDCPELFDMTPEEIRTWWNSLSDVQHDILSTRN